MREVQEGGDEEQINISADRRRVARERSAVRRNRRAVKQVAPKAVDSSVAVLSLLDKRLWPRQDRRRQREPAHVEGPENPFPTPYAGVGEREDGL